MIKLIDEKLDLDIWQEVNIEVNIEINKILEYKCIYDKINMNFYNIGEMYENKKK